MNSGSSKDSKNSANSTNSAVSRRSKNYLTNASINVLRAIASVSRGRNFEALKQTSKYVRNTLRNNHNPNAQRRIAAQFRGIQNRSRIQRQRGVTDVGAWQIPVTTILVDGKKRMEYNGERFDKNRAKRYFNNSGQLQWWMFAPRFGPYSKVHTNRNKYVYKRKNRPPDRRAL